MKNYIYITLSLSLLSLLNGCASKDKIVNVSSEHLYSSNYGLVDDYEVDRQIQQEILAQNNPTEIEEPISNPNWTTKLLADPDAVTEENYVQPKPVISYKYKFDPEFHDKAVWRSIE